MLKHFIIILLLTYSLQTQAQIDLQNTTFNIKDTNVIFAGFDNYLKLTNANGKTVKVSSRKAKVEKSDSIGIYKVYSRKDGIDTFFITENGRIIRTKVFVVKTMPIPRFRLGAIKKNSASVAEIIANRGVVFDNTVCNCTIPFRIRTYTLRIKSDRIPEADKIIPIEGQQLSAHAISIIGKLGKNDIIEFSDIVVFFAYGCPKTYNSFTLTIE